MSDLLHLAENIVNIISFPFPKIRHIEKWHGGSWAGEPSQKRMNLHQFTTWLAGSWASVSGIRCKRLISRCAPEHRTEPLIRVTSHLSMNSIFAIPFPSLNILNPYPWIPTQLLKLIFVSLKYFPYLLSLNLVSLVFVITNLSGTNLHKGNDRIKRFNDN